MRSDRFPPTPRQAPLTCRWARLCGAIGIALAGWLGAANDASAQDTAQPPLPVVRLTAGMYNINAEVAQTGRQRAYGLMHRVELAQNAGMLFIFEQEGTQCFWMRNTLIPLAIAFLDNSGHIVNLDEMQPQRDDSHCSTQPVRYVLEMNTGWFTQRGLKPGDRVTGGPFTTGR